MQIDYYPLCYEARNFFLYRVIFPVSESELIKEPFQIYYVFSRYFSLLRHRNLTIDVHLERKNKSIWKQKRSCPNSCFERVSTRQSHLHKIKYRSKTSPGSPLRTLDGRSYPNPLGPLQMDWYCPANAGGHLGTTIYKECLMLTVLVGFYIVILQYF